jgi:hypothetical protein
MTEYSSDRTPRYLIHTVGLDRDMVAQPTLFTRRTCSHASASLPTGPCLRVSDGDTVMAGAFSELETRILMRLLEEDSHHGFYPIVPVLVSTDTETRQHRERVANLPPWIEMDLAGMGGEGWCTAIGSTLEKGRLCGSLLGLHEQYEGSFYVDCCATTRLREGIPAISPQKV